MSTGEGTVTRHGLDAFLSMCMRHYSRSLAMQYANAEAQAALTRFMTETFVPAWKAAILQHLEQEQAEALDETVALEQIHSELYLRQGFAVEENRIFQATDPEGFKRFMDASTRMVVEDGGKAN